MHITYNGNNIGAHLDHGKAQYIQKYIFRNSLTPRHVKVLIRL